MKRTIRAIMALGLVWLLVGAPEALLAARRNGARLRMTLTNNEVVQGELIGVRGETLVLLTGQGDQTVGLGDVATLLIKDTSGTMIGGLTGLAAGVIVDATMWHSFNKDTSDEEGGLIIRAILTPAAIAATGLIAGGACLVGMLIGHAAHKGKTYKLQGMTQEEMRGLMETLRKHAMVPNYK
jgi:hypothetical protein